MIRKPPQKTALNVLVWLMAGFLSACTAEQLDQYTECVTLDDVRSHCGFRNPEDIEALPDGRHLLVSEMSRLGKDEPGSLALFDTVLDKTVRIQLQMGERNWGDMACDKPDLDRLSPHGIYLYETDTGARRLLAVNHAGARDSVEAFEVYKDAADNWNLRWQGALCPPEDAFLNDVTATADGRVFTTQMFHKSALASDLSLFWLILRASFGGSTGWLWQWHPDTGYAIVPNTEGGFPNGVVVSQPHKAIFVAYGSGNRLVRLHVDSYEIQGSIEMAAPDNFVVDGTDLWVASLDSSLSELELCAGRGQGPCLLPFSVYRIDLSAPFREGAQEKVLSQPRNSPPHGAISVAHPAFGRLWLGAFSGDRITSIALPQPPAE